MPYNGWKGISIPFLSQTTGKPQREFQPQMREGPVYKAQP